MRIKAGRKTMDIRGWNTNFRGSVSNLLNLLTNRV